MREGSLEAPIRHPLGWKEEEFWDEQALDAETRRVFDVCHGCRRCFNLCESFPNLFDLVDESDSGEVDGVASADFPRVVDACTLCDKCFMAKCPYVPPHEFNIDFPHLMLRHRALQFRKGEVSRRERRVIATDRNGKWGSALAPLANYMTKPSNKLGRSLLRSVLGIHPRAQLPPFAGKTLLSQENRNVPELNIRGVAAGRRALLFATCLSNYHLPEIGLAARTVLARNGVESKFLYPECCGMPQLEQGDLEAVAGKAERIAAALKSYWEDGWDIVSLIPSCSLMMKSEWPLLLPDNAELKELSGKCFDLSEYIVQLLGKHGQAPDCGALEGRHAHLQIACHAQAQNVGHKGVEMLRLIPGLKVTVTERCSGHGGSWGATQEHFDSAVKLAAPATQAIVKKDADYVSSECPLAGQHLSQVIEMTAKKPHDEDAAATRFVCHPIVLLAQAYASGAAEVEASASPPAAGQSAGESAGENAGGDAGEGAGENIGEDSGGNAREGAGE